MTVGCCCDQIHVDGSNGTDDVDAASVWWCGAQAGAGECSSVLCAGVADVCFGANGKQGCWVFSAAAFCCGSWHGLAACDVRVYANGHSERCAFVADAVVYRQLFGVGAWVEVVCGVVLCVDGWRRRHRRTAVPDLVYGALIPWTRPERVRGRTMGAVVRHSGC